MIRVPGPGRFELRLMDGATNPYLLQAGIIAAGLDGMNRKRNPGKPVHVNMYEESHKVKGAKKLPLTLEKSLDHLSKSKVMQSAFGKNIINSYVKLKNKEIQKSRYEHERYQVPLYQQKKVNAIIRSIDKEYLNEISKVFLADQFLMKFIATSETEL